MQHSKRIDKMIGDLRSLQQMIARIEAVQGTIDHQVKRQRTTKKPRPAGADTALNHITGDLLKIWSKIRGYHLEAEILHKQLVVKRRDILSEASGEKQGDAASFGKAKYGGKMVTNVYQAKSVSSAGNQGVNSAIDKAFKQLFGSKDEIPAPRAKLVVRIDINSSKCYWPFTENDFKKKIPGKSEYKDKIRTLFDRKALNDLYEVEGSKHWDQPRKQTFIDNVHKSTIKMTVHYKKQAVLNGLPINRSREGAVGGIQVFFKASSTHWSMDIDSIQIK